jgi:hypothetical protein
LLRCVKRGHDVADFDGIRCDEWPASTTAEIISHLLQIEFVFGLRQKAVVDFAGSMHTQDLGATGGDRLKHHGEMLDFEWSVSFPVLCADVGPLWVAGFWQGKK